MKIDKFFVRIVRKGDRYGLKFCLTHNENEPMVEFYDSRYPHTEFGQFVSRYNANTLLEGDNTGLYLYGNEPAWTVSAEDMAAVRVWLELEVA